MHAWFLNIHSSFLKASASSPQLFLYKHRYYRLLPRRSVSCINRTDWIVQLNCDGRTDVCVCVLSAHAGFIDQCGLKVCGFSTALSKWKIA